MRAANCVAPGPGTIDGHGWGPALSGNASTTIGSVSVIHGANRLAVTVGETVISTSGAIRAIEDTIAASEALREHLKRTERVGRKMVSALQRGVAMSAAVEAAGECPADLRLTSKDYLGNYELSRHRMREVFVLGSLDEGCPLVRSHENLAYLVSWLAGWFTKPMPLKLSS